MYPSLDDKRPGVNWKGRRLSPRVRCVLADNPSPMTFVGTNTWIVSEPNSHDCVVIDPGPLSDKHQRAILAACREDNLTIGAIMLTHNHLDHSKGAASLAKVTSVPLYARSDGSLDTGSFSVMDISFEIVPLPGHSEDSIGLCYPSDRSIFTGDILFLQSPTVICWPEGTLSAYLESLDRLEKLVREGLYSCLLPGHGLPIEDPISLIHQTRHHREQRLEQVRSAIKRSTTLDLDSIMEIVYSDIDQRLDPAACRNMQAQLEYLEQAEGLCLV